MGRWGDAISGIRHQASGILSSPPHHLPHYCHIPLAGVSKGAPIHRTLNTAQIVSGTLAYTVGAGKTVISTPYWYAEEMLADRRGKLVPFHDPEAIASEVLVLLANEGERHAMRKRAYMLGREMAWPHVAQRYLATFDRARAKYYRSSCTLQRAKLLHRQSAHLPQLRLDHLQRMTDTTGIV